MNFYTVLKMRVEMKLIKSLTKYFFLVLGLLAALEAGFAQPAAIALPITTVDKKQIRALHLAKTKLNFF